MMDVAWSAFFVQTFTVAIWIGVGALALVMFFALHSWWEDRREVTQANVDDLTLRIAEAPPHSIVECDISVLREHHRQTVAGLIEPDEMLRQDVEMFAKHKAQMQAVEDAAAAPKTVHPSQYSGECIPLTTTEVMSQYDRVWWAEQMILQIPYQHPDRNAWLMNYGRSSVSVALRAQNSVVFDENTKAARLS
jgi:hypothetical protein